jgi:hypothetical protein
MSASAHPLATHHLPGFITAPGETDVLMNVMAGILVVSVMMFGIFFLRLHTLPERLAHRTHKLQFEIVAVLGLLALFTHMHIFWVAGLMLALIDLPDFGTPLNRIAGSVEKLAGVDPPGQPDEHELPRVEHREAAMVQPRDVVTPLKPREAVAGIPHPEPVAAATRS